MAEASIASAIAAPYTYKVESNEWILRSETYARIELLGDNTRTQFRIVVLGQVEGRVEVIVNLSLFKEIIYHRSSGLFHQFADKTSLVGLRFPSEEDAARFATSFENVINLLNNPQPNTPLPMPSGYPPTPPVSASMPVSSPLAAGNSFPSSHVDSVFSSSPTPLRTPIQRRDSSSGGDASAFHAGAVTAESRSQLGGRKPLLGANRDVADASPTTPDVGSPPEPQTAAVGKTFVRTTSSTGSSNALLASNPSMRSPSPAVAKVQVSAPKTGASPRAAPALLKASAVPVTPNPEMKLRPSLTGSLPPPPEEFATAPVPPPPVAVVDPAPPALSPLRASPLTDTSSSTMSSLSSDSPLRSSVQSFSSQSFASPNGGSPIASAVSAPANVSPRGTPAAVTPLSPKSVSIAPSAKATPSKPPPLLVPKTAPTTAPAPAPVVTLPPAALTSPSAPQLGTLRHGAQAPSPQTTTIRRNVDQNILTLGLTPGTSAAMEKLEAAEEQTRHRLKIDLSDPRWKAATLFVQLMIECSEQLFPNKGRFVLSTMPKLIKRSLEYLETEAALVENVFLYEYLEKLERLDRLKAYIDKDQDLTKASREQTVHLIAELVKRHCRDIPGQLINLEAYDPTYSFCDMPDDASRLQYIQELVDTLPATSKVVLECVITLLARVHAASSVTKMDAMRLGAVFAPLLLRPQLLEYKRPQPIPLSVRLEL